MPPPKRKRTTSKGASKKGSSIIQNYGLYWAKNYVNWGAKGKGLAAQLQGCPNKSCKAGTEVNFWQQTGLYILYDAEKNPVYFGQAGVRKNKKRDVTEGAGVGNSIGSRLRAHTRGDIGEMWQSFSWFGVKPVRKDRTLGSAKVTSITVTAEVAVIEALLISVLPKGTQNKQDGAWSHVNAARFFQDKNDNNRRKNDKEFRLLLEIKEGLEKILASQSTPKRKRGRPRIATRMEGNA